MKIRRSRHPQYDLFATLQTHFDIDARRLIVLCALILGMIQTRSVVLWRLVPVVQLGENENSVYKRFKRFMRYSLCQTMVAKFILAFLGAGIPASDGSHELEVGTAGHQNW